MQLRKSVPWEHAQNVHSQKVCKTKHTAYNYGVFLVQVTGVEPARACAHMDLNHTRLPIPPYLLIPFRLSP